MTNVNNNDIDRIVGELISLEPDLNDKKTELRELVSKLLEAKPDVKVDDQFVARLRRELLAGESNPSTATAAPIANFNQFMTKLKYALGGSAVMAVLVLIAVFAAAPGQDRQVISDLISSRSVEKGVDALKPNAFGRLSQAEGVQTETFGSPESAKAGGLGSAVMSAPSSDDAVAEPMPISIGMPAPEYQPAELTYRGDEIAAPAEQLLVYRRVKELDLSGLNSAVASQDNGLIELNNFRNLNVQNISLRDEQQGIWINLNPRDATANISIENGIARIMHEQKVDPIPDDDLIRLANDALDRYGIERTEYGTPVVNHSWKNYAAREGGELSFPMHINVVYPLEFPEGEVINYDGSPHGLSVMVNTAERKVTNISMITVHKYESSQYTAETDVAKLIAYAEEGGRSGTFYLPEGKTQNIALGTPTMHYMLQHQYDAEAGTTSELYVPALFFPVELENDDGFYHSKMIVVPLIKELLEQNGGMGGVPTPMPRVMEASSGGAIEIQTPLPGEPAIIRVEAGDDE